MKAITLRNIPPETAEQVEQKARDWNLSLNRTVLRILETALQTGRRDKNQARHHELDDLAGVWSAEDARQFDEALADQRRIDPELWD